jgi:hypothetical protein
MKKSFTPERFRELATGYLGHVLSETQINELVNVYESAPGGSDTKGGGHMPLNNQHMGEILRILKVNGTGPDVISNVAKQYGVQEAIIRAAGSVITESSPPDVDSTRAPARTARAQRFAEVVNRAEAKPIAQATHQDLEALAAAYWS